MPPKPPQFTNGDSFSIAPGHKATVSRRLQYLGKFLMIYAHALAKASGQLNEGTSILTHIISKVERQNQVFFRINKLAEDLNTSRNRISRHLIKMRNLGIIEPDPEDATASHVTLWRVCPFLVWVGTGDDLRKYLKTLPKTHPFFNYQDPSCTEEPQ